MMHWSDRIHSDPEVLTGKPVIKGTRLSVEFLLERLASGWSSELLLENYPTLQRLDIEALLACASDRQKNG